MREAGRECLRTANVRNLCLTSASSISIAIIAVLH